MATFGLTPAGLVVKTLNDIKLELQTDLRSLFGASIDVSETSNFGQFIGTMADRFSDGYELAQAVYSSTDPDKATDQALIALSAITGTFPKAAKSSIVGLIATGSVATILPAGRVASVVVIGTKFQTLNDATLGSANAWLPSTAYVAGDIVTNGGNIYYCSVAGTSAGSSGPSGSSMTIVDGSVTWSYAGQGTAFAVIQASSIETGPRIAVAGSLTTIETPVSGWLSVNNMVDATLGNDADNNPRLRARRQQELLGNSKSVLDSIRTRLLEDVPGVSSVIVFQNDTETTNGDGMPAHSVECLVRGGDPQDITNAVFANVAAGITMYGNTSGTVVDVANGGQTYTVGWSRPVTHDIYLIVNVKKDPASFPADGAAQILNSLLAFGDAFNTGQDVVSARLKAQCFGSINTDPDSGKKTFIPIAGVLDVPTLFIDTSASPTTETTLVMTLRDLAEFDSSRITINLTDGTP